MAIESRLSFLLLFAFCPSLRVLIILMLLFLSDSLRHSFIYCPIVSSNFPPLIKVTALRNQILYMSVGSEIFFFLNSIPFVVHLALLSF